MLSVDNLKQYLLSEFSNNIQYSAADTKYTHTQSITKNGAINNIITIKMKLVDKDMIVLSTNTIKFINDTLPIKTKLINIAPAELINRFVAAKPDIVAIIRDEYTKRLNDIEASMNELNSYSKYNNTTNNTTNSISIHKPTYDM